MKTNIFNVFPKPIQDFTMEVKEGLNLDQEFVLSSILYAASVGIGNSYSIRIKNGWNEGTNLFMIIVGSTGVAKTPAISTAVSPLIKMNQKYFNDWKKKDEEYEAKMTGKNEETNNYDDTKKPVRKQIIAEDATIEAIFRSHANNPKGFGIYYDEVIGFFNNMGKYNKGSDQEQWLKIWSRKPINVDRVSSKPISVSLPHISLIGGTQTKLLCELFKDNRDKNGFVERLLFVKPENLTKCDFPEGRVPMYVLAEYEEIINKLIDIPVPIDEAGNIKPIIIDFTPEAKELYKSYFNKNAKLYRVGKLPEDIKGFYPKMDTYCARFSLILQLLYWACGEESNTHVGTRAVNGAIILCEYFLENARNVLETIKQPIELSNEHRKLLAVELWDKKTFSLREIGSFLSVSHETVRKWVNTSIDS